MSLITLMKSKFLKDTAFLWVGSGITTGTYFITSILLARSLGAAELGRYELAYRIYDLCYFVANLGLINVTVVLYSRAMGAKDQAGKARALASFLKIYLLMAFSILALGFFLAPDLSERIYGDRKVGFYGWTLCILGLVDVMRALAVAMLLGMRNMKQLALFESGIALVRVMVLVLAIVGGYALEGVIYGSVLAALLSSLMGIRIYALARKGPEDERPPTAGEVLCGRFRGPPSGISWAWAFSSPSTRTSCRSQPSSRRSTWPRSAFARRASSGSR